MRAGHKGTMVNPPRCGLLVVYPTAAVAAGQQPPRREPMAAHSQSASPHQDPPRSPSVAAAQAVVSKTCSTCHNDRTRSGSLSLESFDLANAGRSIEITEKMIRKLRAGLIPPPGSRRPAVVAAAAARKTTFPLSPWTPSRAHVGGAPLGPRGGVPVVHTFPADGDYRFRVSFYHETTGALYGNGRAALHTAEAPEQIEISIDGARAALLEIDRWMSTSDPDGVNLRTEPIAIAAGPHRIAAAFIRR